MSNLASFTGEEKLEAKARALGWIIDYWQIGAGPLFGQFRLPVRRWHRGAKTP